MTEKYSKEYLDFVKFTENMEKAAVVLGISLITLTSVCVGTGIYLLSTGEFDNQKKDIIAKADSLKTLDSLKKLDYRPK